MTETHRDAATIAATHTAADIADQKPGALAGTPVGDDDESPYLGTTLNSVAASASVNNITGEVSLTVPLVNIPTSQGLGPVLTINLVYNSTSSGGQNYPYLDAIAFGGFQLQQEPMPNTTFWAPFGFYPDWDLDLPAIIHNGKTWSLRFQGQSWQANLNQDDSSPDKTAFYYAKALENGNKLKLSYANGTDITGGANITTPNGVRYVISTGNGGLGWILSTIESPNGTSLRGCLRTTGRAGRHLTAS